MTEAELEKKAKEVVMCVLNFGHLVQWTLEDGVDPEVEAQIKGKG